MSKNGKGSGHKNALNNFECRANRRSESRNLLRGVNEFVRTFHIYCPIWWDWGRNKDWGCSRIGCWGGYLGLRDEATGDWRRLHNEELNDLYSSPNVIRVIKSRRLRWAGHVARMVEERGAYRILVGRPEGRRPLGRPRRRWEDNIKMDIREVGWGDMNWIDLAQDRDGWRALVNAVMNLRVP
jgi:hypothetical protein